MELFENVDGRSLVEVGVLKVESDEELEAPAAE